MADLVRVTGKCGLVKSQKVVSKQEATKGQEFVFHTATVIVADSGVVELRFDPTRDGRTFAYGDQIDVLAEATAYGRNAQISYVSDYPRILQEQEADRLLQASTA